MFQFGCWRLYNTISNMFGLTFHPYGLIIGIALVAGWEFLRLACKKYQISFDRIKTSVVMILVGGFIFARLWHGVTDWYLYAPNPIALLYVWQGGMSIIGGIIGGCLVAVGLILFQSKLSLSKEKLSFLLLTDLVVHALPISQIIGRLGNFVNQELYGLPTQLSWGIYIDVEHRLGNVATQSHFHPLFLYEMLLNFVIALWIWRSKWQLGAGGSTGLYLVLYGFGRLLLDFLRIDRGKYVWIGLSLNQYVLLVLVIIGLALLGRKHYQAKSAKIGR